jgi:hypothetical protein
MNALTRRLCSCVLAVAGSALACAAASAAGISLPRPDARGPLLYHDAGWGGRVGLSGSLLGAGGTEFPQHLEGVSGSGLTLRSLHLVGDYYFSSTSGFHATTGLIRGSLSSPWGSSNSSRDPWAVDNATYDLWTPVGRGDQDGVSRQTLPYVGAGYSISTVGPGSRGGWRFSADLGLALSNAGPAGNVGLMLHDPTALGDMMHLLRVQPLVQLGLKYSF